ncbi:MAG TPA: post-transcriptional regulator [Bacilli bacterium]|nr:post-transcriptional regulator [Bacilli bacterium]
MSEGYKPEAAIDQERELTWEEEQELAQRMAAEEEEQGVQAEPVPAIPDEAEDSEPFATSLSEQELTKELERLCQSKAAELRMLGYEQVTGTDVWQCIAAKYKKGAPPLYQLVNDILSLKPTAFMNWLMINAYKG